MSFEWAAYRLIAPLIGSLAPMARWFTSPHERALWNERLGDVESSGECDAWIHAASLGEALAVPALTRELLALAPRAKLRVSATTRSGRGRLMELGLPASLAPIDSPQAVAKFFERVRPRRLMLVETELWPHWLLHARATRTPVVVVSARLSTRSVESYRKLGREFRELVASLTGVVAQSDRDAARWSTIGAGRITVAGNLKHDALPDPPPSRAAARAGAGLDRDRPLLVLGSLRPGEARLLAHAWRAVPLELRLTWQVMAVPRHARATSELAEEAEASGVFAPDRGGEPGSTWHWDGRPGVLQGYYAAADVAFVGGSLVRRGGHNPLEPAASRVAVLMGPHHGAQLDGVHALEANRAITIVRSVKQAAETLEHLLGDPEAREQQAAAARAVAESLRGVARRTVARLAEWNVWPPA